MESGIKRRSLRSMTPCVLWTRLAGQWMIKRNGTNIPMSVCLKVIERNKEMKVVVFGKIFPCMSRDIMLYVVWCCEGERNMIYVEWMMNMMMQQLLLCIRECFVY